MNNEKRQELLKTLLEEYNIETTDRIGRLEELVMAMDAYIEGAHLSLKEAHRRLDALENNRC